MKLLLVAWILFACGSARADEAGDARAFVETWLAAQNRADFATYKALYAQSFTGVRRSGRSATKLDHDGWLRDRKHMFAHAMTVSASDLVVTPAKDAVDVRFVQAFALGEYSDRGPKLLRLVHGDHGLSIAHEEMLASKLDPEPSETLPELSTIAFVQDGELVVQSEIDPALRSAVRSLVAKKSGIDIRVRGRIGGKHLPPALASLVGRRFRVFGSVEACVAHVSGTFFARAKLESFSDNPIPIPKTMKDLDDYPEYPVRVVAELVPESGTCTGGVWARDASVTTPLASTKPDRAAVDTALESLRRLPEYAKIQREYDKSKQDMIAAHEMKAPGPAHWDELDPSVSTDVFQLGATTTVHLRIEVGEGCGESVFGGTLEAIYEITGASVVLRYLGQPNTYDSLSIVSLVDLDGDGVPELVVDGGEYGHSYLQGAILRRIGERYRVQPIVSDPRLYCHC